MSVAMGEIKGGIEFYTYTMDVDGREMPIEDCQCARCGSSCFFDTCGNCGGEGEIELYETDPLWYDEDDTDMCDWCRGSGGSWHCMSDSEWCEAHPMPGREHIETTAYKKDEGGDW